MQKIIAAISISSFSEKKLLSVLDCAEFSRGKITLALVENDPPLPVLTTFEGVGYFNESAMLQYYKEREKIYTEAVQKVFDACDHVGLRTSILHDRPVSVEELVQETRFADLVIVDHAIPFDPFSENGYGNGLVNLLETAACPVLILRDGAIHVEELVFTYNGTSSSTYAIKQFTQLFPALTSKPVVLLYIAEEGKATVPHYDEILNYLHYHYSDVCVRILRGTPAIEICNFLKNRKSSVVTFGAYGRSKLSRFFHPSEANNTLRNLKIPVFITHL